MFHFSLVQIFDLNLEVTTLWLKPVVPKLLSAGVCTPSPKTIYTLFEQKKKNIIINRHNFHTGLAALGLTLL